MKRRESLFGAFFLGLTAMAGTALTALPALAQDQITLGAIEILSGDNSRYGIPIKRALDLAVEEINAKGGVLGRKINLIVEDSAGNKEQAINAARKLIGRDKVSLIIGPTLSNEMFAAGPVANDRKIPIIGTSTTAPGITAIGPYVFRTSLPESDVVPVTLKTAQTKFGVKNVAVMYGNDDAFTKGGYDVMAKALANLGINVVTTETFGGKDTDFSAQLTKIKSLNVDAIVVSALVEAASGIALQARQLGIPDKVRIIGGNGFNSPKLGEIAGKSANGILVGSPWFIDKPDAANQTFVAAFRKKYDGATPDQFAAQGYDTMYIAAQAIQRAGGTDADKLRVALGTVEYSGVLGPFRFSEGRDPASNDGVVVLEMNDGKFRILP